MPGTTSTAIPSYSHNLHHETDAAKPKGGLSLTPVRVHYSANSF